MINIQRIATGQGDDYTTDCLLDYPYFKDLLEIYFDVQQYFSLLKKQKKP